MIHEVEVPGGRVLKIEGPEDASDDELIGIAKQHLSAQKAPKAPAEQPTAKAPSGSVPPSDQLKVGELPAMSTPEQLLKDAKQSTPGLKADIPGAFEATQGTNALPTLGGLYDLASKGDLSDAWNALPESVRTVTEIGGPPAIGAYALKKAYDMYQGSKEPSQGGQGIKSRTIGGGTQTPTAPAAPVATANPAAPTAAPVAAPSAPSYTPKEAKLAQEIENKYGYKWSDIKSNYGLTDVPVTDPLHGEMLASNFSQQQKAAAPVTPTVTAASAAPAAEVIAPVAETVPAKPAAPPAEAPKAAVVPEAEKLTKEQKGMKNHLVSMYGGGPEGEAAYTKVKEILGKTPEFPKGQGGGLSPEQTKIIKDWRKVNIEGPKVNLTYDMKKALKGGAGLAVLAAIPGFAEAAQNKDIGKMTDIATDFLVLPFAQSREVGAGEEQALAKARYEGMVGGGRGITPAQAYNVGAGRGVAPPSAYLR